MLLYDILMDIEAEGAEYLQMMMADWIGPEEKRKHWLQLPGTCPSCTSHLANRQTEQLD